MNNTNDSPSDPSRPAPAGVIAYADALGNIEEAYRDGIRAFADWVAANWGMTREEWVKSIAEPPPPEEWFNGHKSALETIPDAVKVFLEEVGCGC